MATGNFQKQILGMAGEYGVCSELSARGLQCSIVFGNAKAVDIVVTDSQNNTYKTIEVKTSRGKNIVTNFFQKYHSPTQTPHPDIWILVHINSTYQFEYYIFTHNELAQEQMKRNKMTSWQYVKGCDTLKISSIGIYKNQWQKI
jgi:hypothetical protein